MNLNTWFIDDNIEKSIFHLNNIRFDRNSCFCLRNYSYQFGWHKLVLLFYCEIKPFSFPNLGAQWGDEGKGKVVDMLATDADVVCRCQVRK